ncbi:MAG: hypothetical protein ABI678_12220 [Kofleriaceae bacterium]
MTLSFAPEIPPHGLASVMADWRMDHVPSVVGDQRSLRAHRPSPPERFTALVIAQLLRGVAEAWPLVSAIARAHAHAHVGTDRAHFFLDPARLPADADCTAVGLLLLLDTGHLSERDAHRALELIAQTTTSQGVVATYFERSGDRANIVDAVVRANVVRLARRLGRLDEVAATRRYLHALVASDGHLDGSRYYPSPDSLLYTLALGDRFEALRPAVRARIGATDHVLDLAQRCLAADRLGIANTRDREALRARRLSDGTWPAEGWFCYGRSRAWFGSRALSTAFALAALEAG